MILRRVLALAASAALSLTASMATAAMTKLECAKANADGQASRLDGKLTDARSRFQRCVDPSCPSIVRDDCAQRLAELDRVQPTILFDVKDGAGEDVGTVNVSVDGLPMAERGLALPVDPGDHTFTFVAPGKPPLTRHFVLKEGEKNRRERVVLGPLVTVPPVDSDTTKIATTPGLGTQKILGISAAGLGVIGIALGSVFGAETFSAVSRQGGACASPAVCPDPSGAASDHATAASDAVVSTVAFVAAGALLAGGAILFFTAPRANGSSGTTGIMVLPSAGPGGGGISLRAEF